MACTAGATALAAATLFPVDGHVHFHRRALVAATLDAAAANFSRLLRSRGPLLGALLVVESSRERVYEQIARTRVLEGWRFTRVADEPQTTIARRGAAALAIVCGRQIRCALGLEALALGTTRGYPEGLELEDAVGRIVADGALAVLPWGFGKWTGRAGRRVRRMFDSASRRSLFAGDNGGRMQILGQPALLQRASRAGLRILPGTDPFPFGGDCRRVGAFGFLAPSPDPLAPFRSLREWLDAGGLPVPYGRALGPFRFLYNQGAIQVYNRVGVAP